MLNLLLTILLVGSALGSIHESSSLIGVSKLGNCRAKLDDGRIVDFSSVKSSYSDTSGIWRYTYSPCSTQPCAGSPAAICQEGNSGAYTFNLGDLDSVQFSMFDNELSMLYSTSDKKSTVICICSELSKLKFELESPQSNYKMTFSDPCCCPDRCKASSSPKKLSGGSVLLIIFFCMLFVYFVGGVVYLKYVRNQSGAELVPNREFWTSLPGHVFSGVAFIKSKLTGKPANNYDQI